MENIIINLINNHKHLQNITNLGNLPSSNNVNLIVANSAGFSSNNNTTYGEGITYSKFYRFIGLK